MIVSKLETNIAEHVCDGLGSAAITSWYGSAQLCPNSRLLATITLPPGASVGDHPHHGEAEIYCLVSGNGTYNDNGEQKPVKAGDVTICYDGEMHGLVNSGKEDIVFHAIIIAG